MISTKWQTPIERVDNIYVKRDDLYKIAGVCGGKARTCWHLAEQANKGFVTASSRYSPQAVIVAHIAYNLCLPCNLHMPFGNDTEEMTEARKNEANIIQHKPGYNSVIISRAKQDAQEKGWTYIPFGMECQEAVEQTSRQVVSIPDYIKRIVVPVGSGMTLAGILHGLERYNRRDITVLGIVVGASPLQRLNTYAPLFWQARVKLVKSSYSYDTKLENKSVGKILLDPVYEAKCLEYTDTGDLFWIVGNRRSK